MEHGVVSKEVNDFMRSDGGTEVSIESLESGVWSEVSNVAKPLSGSFETSLTVTNGDEDVLKSSFRFVTEHGSL